MGKRNWLDPIGLQHFAEAPVDGGDGQPGEEPVAAAVADAAALTGEPEAPFYEYEDPSGTKTSYKDATRKNKVFAMIAKQKKLGKLVVVIPRSICVLGYGPSQLYSRHGNPFSRTIDSTTSRA